MFGWLKYLALLCISKCFYGYEFSLARNPPGHPQDHGSFNPIHFSEWTKWNFSGHTCFDCLLFRFANDHRIFCSIGI